MSSPLSRFHCLRLARRAVACSLVVLALSACGSKGGLYLPPSDESPNPNSQRR